MSGALATRPMHGRLLITGLSGFLGAHCAWRFREQWEVFGTIHRSTVGIPGVRTVRMDLANTQAVAEAVAAVQPEVILHAGAMTKPEACERRPGAATAVNVHGTAALCAAAREVGARLIYVSTDLVFSGRHAPYDEHAPPHPLSHYGRTKLQGERLVRQCGDLGCTLRTSILYGWPKGPHGCFLDWFVQGVKGDAPLRLFTDQRRAFLFIEDAVEMIRRVLAQPTTPHLLHLAGGEAGSRYTFGQHFCEIFGWPTTSIEPGSMEEMRDYAARPADCSLSGDRFAHRYDFRARAMWDGLLALSEHSRGAVFGPRPLERP